MEYAPPSYNPAPNGNAGFYGGQQNGIELQQPGQTYQPPGGAETYAPPAGPPPKKRGLFR